jgi:hypothetical protein
MSCHSAALNKVRAYAARFYLNQMAKESTANE